MEEARARVKRVIINDRAFPASLNDPDDGKEGSDQNHQVTR